MNIRAYLMLTIVLTGRPVVANNNLFLPGDAFFPTELTSENLALLTATREQPARFAYSSFGGYESAFCGYAGYSVAEIPAVDPPFLANLKLAYQRIRNHDPRKLVEIGQDRATASKEINGIRVLFYPVGFDFCRYKVGLQYNEQWVDEAVKFGHQRSTLRLCSLVDDRRAVEESWRDATAVAALPVTLPEVELKPVPATTEPIVVQGKVKAVVLDSRPLTAYFRPQDDEVMFVVDSTGITELRYFADSCEWQVIPPHK